MSNRTYFPTKQKDQAFPLCQPLPYPTGPRIKTLLGPQQAETGALLRVKRIARAELTGAGPGFAFRVAGRSRKYKHGTHVHTHLGFSELLIKKVYNYAG